MDDSITYIDWRSKIEKELKGRPVSDLKYRLNDRIVIDTVYHEAQVQPIEAIRSEKWSMGMHIDGSHANARQDIISALNHGIEHLYIDVDERTMLSSLLDDVRPDWVEVVLISQTAHVAQHVEDYRQRHAQGQELISSFSSNLDLSTLFISTPLEYDDADVDYWLAEAFNKIINQLDAERFHRLDKIVLEIGAGLGHHDLVATCRAARLVWQGLQKHLPGHLPKFDLSYLLSLDQELSMSDALIHAMPRALAAIMGTANRLTVASHEVEDHNRLLRNLAHLLRMEAGLEEPDDIWAGALFMDVLSQSIAYHTWQRICNK